MDAYSSYILRLAEARSRELRREATEYALARAARQRRASLWARIRGIGARRSRPSVIPMPRPATPLEPEAELPRSA